MNSNCVHINDANITFSVAGKQVYKDQCVRCFDDAKSQGGLDICLKCFMGNCKSEMFNHSKLHYNQKNHALVLNIKQVLVEGEQNKEINKENSTKITKIAIGKPGGADFSGESWESELRVFCYGCNQDVEYTNNPNLKDLVTSIATMNSADQKSDLNAWELDIIPCEHTLTLQQMSNKKIASKMLAHCNDCALSSNLWLCLTCGNLGCGRKNYDGSGGNSHAIEHFKQTQHPLVVKTGTITPDGEASLYCYSCDTDVKDLELPLHLSTLGIDVTTQTKTEKTMTELNLEMNLNLTLSKTIEEGKVLTPIYGPGHTGIQNLGNSCYMNSVLQILFSLETFQKLYLDNALNHLNTCYEEPPNCFYCQVSKVIYGMYSGAYSTKQTRKLPITEEGKEAEIEEFQTGIRPASFKHLFGRGHPEFSTNKQQDALEYLAYILEKFEREERKLNRPNPKSDFEFDIEERYECVKCHGIKYKKQRTWYLPLNVPNWENKKDESSVCTFEECASKFLGEEIIDLSCSVCTTNTQFVKTQRVLNFPRYLVILFQRFVYDWVPIKLEVQFKPIINGLDLKILSTNHRKDNEKIIEDKSDDEIVEVDPEINQEQLNLLLGNGVPELAAKHSPILNNNDGMTAMMWYFENMDNPVLNTPIQKIKKSKVSNSAPVGGNVNIQFDDNAITLITDMGFSINQAKGALMKCDNNTERALDYLFNHPDENFGDQPLSQPKANTEINKNNSPFYNLYGFITHLGKNTSHGHYVAHINKGQQWIYYNDEKVAISNDPPLHKGYIYAYNNQS